MSNIKPFNYCIFDKEEEILINIDVCLNFNKKHNSALPPATDG